MRSPAAEQQALLSYVRQRPTFSVPRLGRGVHRPAAAALRSEAGDLGVVGMATSPRLRSLVALCRLLAGVRPRLCSRGCAGNGQFLIESDGLSS